MTPTLPICLYTFDRIQEDDRDSIVRGLLQIRVDIEDVRILTKYQQSKQPTQNAIRYLIGRFLNVAHTVQESQPKHFAWVKKNLGLEEHQDRRLRRHARNIETFVTEGMDILEVLKLPALTLRGAKSRKGREVEQNLDALRNLRGDLQSKIVTK